jgi:6-pyruvoyltetrahydropterin/6-carboxytetrahydropterin synthase
MYELMVENIFSAAHQLTGSNGPCEGLHGHTWKVQVYLHGEKLDKIGMLVDFKMIKSALNTVLQDYDHKFLNDSLKFSPTAENIARDIYEKMAKGSPLVSKVTIWESPTACATYSADQ